MDDAALIEVLLLATLAGCSIPVGAWLATKRWGLLPDWLELEARHAVIAFGGGALVVAVVLVLIPEGEARLRTVPAVVWFLTGGVCVAFVDRWIAQSRGKAAQFLAMMLDYLPEALALGAVISGDPATAVLVALLICLQNLPESFNAMREMTEAAPDQNGPSLWAFAAMVPLGPLAALAGLSLPATFDPAVGAAMMLSSGGILYLMFQDIAPQIPLENKMLPPLCAILSFSVGLTGHLMMI